MLANVAALRSWEPACRQAGKETKILLNRNEAAASRCISGQHAVMERMYG